MKVKEEFVAFLDGIDDFSPIVEGLGAIETLPAGEGVQCTRCGRLLKSVHYVNGAAFGPVCVTRIGYFSGLTVDELRDIARANEIDYKGMKKNDLVKVALIHDNTSEWTNHWNERFTGERERYGWERIVESRKLKNGNRLYLAKEAEQYVVALVDTAGDIIEEIPSPKYEGGIASYRDLRDSLVAQEKAEEPKEG